MKTVLNKKKRDNLAQPLFLGEELGLQRYDNPKYPVFMKLFRDQYTNMWMPEEVTLGRDRNDFKALTDEERFVFTSNLKWQTMTDSMLSRSIHEMTKYISSNELEICCGIWSTFEQIHSYSYSYIMDNVVENSTEFFDSILETPEIEQRATEISAAYDKLLGNSSDIKQSIFDSILSTQITEGLAFYTSFACSYFFGYRGKMEGNAKIISLIARDENLHVAITQNIMKIWKENPEEGFQGILKDNEQKIYDAYGLAVENEKSWANYLFSNGSLLGLNANVLGGYIEWLANNRLQSLGYKKMFDQKVNPIAGWLDSYMDSSKLQVAPQETEISSYKISSRDTEISETAFDDFKL